MGIPRALQPDRSGIPLFRQQEAAIAQSCADVSFPTTLRLWVVRGPGFAAVTLPGQPDPFHPRRARPGERRDIWSLQFDPYTGTAGLTGRPDPADAAVPREPALMSAYAWLGRAATFSPQSRALTAHLISLDQTTWAGQVLRQAFAGGLPLGGTVRDGRIGSIHPAWLTGMYGWYPSGTDPTVFGTPYLAISPVAHSDMAPVTAWGLFLTGLPEPLHIARWNDLPRLHHLLDLTGGAPDDLLVEYMLTFGLDAVRAGAVNHADGILQATARQRLC